MHPVPFRDPFSPKSNDHPNFLILKLLREWPSEIKWQGILISYRYIDKGTGSGRDSMSLPFVDDSSNRNSSGLCVTGDICK